MTTKVHKYLLQNVINEVDTHAGARFLHVGNRHADVIVWAEVDEEKPPCTRRLNVTGTGFAVPSGDYVGSAVVDTSNFAFHVYAEPEAS